MIATLKVLGLQARGAQAIFAAARRVVEYVQGGPAGQASRLKRYYGDEGGDHSGGRARGAAAEHVGLRGQVPGGQLEQLLTGRHAVTGAPLLPAAGSAGRASARHSWTAHVTRSGGVADIVTLAEAAQAAGVSPQYLRRLAEENALLAAVTEADEDWERPAARDHLRAERDPATGRWLVSREELARFVAEREPPTVVIGYDLVCAAPKSVSLLWTFGDDALRTDIAAAMHAGVDAAISYLERHAAVGTVSGRNRPGLGLAVASYTHDVSRADEPHLHVHNIIVNATPVPVIDDEGRPVLGPNGVARVEWRALDSEMLHTHVKTAGYLGAAAMRHDLARRRGLRWAAVRNGVAELAGFPSALLTAFSSRHGETHEEFVQLVESGFAPDAATLAAAQRGSRAPKKNHADGQVYAVQLDRLAHAGWTAGQVREFGARRRREDLAPPTEEEIAQLFDELAGARGLTERPTSFGPRDVVQAVAAWASDRLEPQAIERLAARFLADSRVVLMGTAARRRRNKPEPVYTTVQLLEVEDNLLALYRQGRVDRGALPRASVEPQLIENGIAAANAKLARRAGPPRARLSDEQADLVRVILASGDLIRPVIGPAGTGKTEAMHAVVHALSAAGGRVVATANGGRQAEELRERLNVDSRVVSSWLTLLDNAADPAKVWTPGTIVIVDEATQVGTRDAERMFRYATRTGAVLVLIGDPAQLGSVAAGGWFAHLVAANPDTPALRQVHRQTGPGLALVRAALQALRSELPDAPRHAMERLARDGRVRLFDTRDGLLAAVVDDWHADRRHGPATPSRMMAERLRDAELLNRAARERLRDDGTLAGPILRAAGRDYQAGDEVITLTQAGHTLVPAGQPRSAYIRTGTVGTVAAVHIDASRPDRQALTVRFPGRGEVRVNWAYLTHAFPDGRDGGLGHAYALTAHKAEGTTMPTARTVVVDDTSKAGCYVMLSRARTDLRAYLVRRHDLEVDLDDEDWLPILHDPAGPLRRIIEHLQQSRAERLAREHDPTAHAAHQLRTRHPLDELSRLRRQAQTVPANGGHDPLLLRRAEIAAETAIAVAAVADPVPELLARIGPRPSTGAERAVWDDAVAALAIYRARHPSVGTPAYDLGPPPPASPDEADEQWQAQRAQAERLANNWAGRLDTARQRGFASRRQQVPRDRAIAGIHALLTNGSNPDTLAAALTDSDQRTIVTAAAVLDHRVHQLLDRHGIDPTLRELPAPTTPHDEWRGAAALLHAAEINHQASRPTADLAADHRTLTALIGVAGTGAAPEHIVRSLKANLRRAEADLIAAAHDNDDATAMFTALDLQARPNRTTRPQAQLAADSARQRLAACQHAVETRRRLVDACRPGADTTPVRQTVALVDAALARQIDNAVARIAQEPARYLTAFLGERPLNPKLAERWERNVLVS